MAASVVSGDICSDSAQHSTRHTSVPPSTNRESHPVSSSRAPVSAWGTASGVGPTHHSLNCPILGTSSGTSSRVILLSSCAEESLAGDKSAILWTVTHSATLYVGLYAKRCPSKSNPLTTPPNSPSGSVIQNWNAGNLLPRLMIRPRMCSKCLLLLGAPSSDSRGGNTSSFHALLDGSCLAYSSRKVMTSVKGLSFFCNGIGVAPWLQHDAMSISVSSAPISIIKTSTSCDTCMRKRNLLGHHLLPSMTSPMCCRART